MGLSSNPRVGSGGVSFLPAHWPGVSESLLKFVATMQTTLLPGPPLDPDAIMLVLTETPLPPPPQVPMMEAPPKKERARKKGGHAHADAASDEEDDDHVPRHLSGSGEDVYKSRQAAKMRRK